VPGGLLGVVDGDPPEVVGVLQRGGDQKPDVDEMRQILEAVETSKPFGVVGGKRNVVSAPELEQGLGPDGAFEVDVELDLRIHRLA